MAAEPRDYYDVLGVAPTAGAEELKRAYRNLAKKFHPDVNKSHDAPDKFKEIQTAYDILSDEGKRRKYDQFGHEGVTGSYPEGFGGGAGGPFGDIFEAFFGQAGASRGPNSVARGDDLREDIELTLEEVAVGAEKTIKFSRMVNCDTCEGTGAKPGTSSDTCTQCNGQGQIRFTQNTLIGTFTTTQTCTRCRGAGKVITSPCQTCSGSGRIRKTRERTVLIPAGAETGLRLRLVGEGDAGERGGPAGDLYLVVFVRDHEIFDRRGNDIECEIPISMARAALGGSIQIPIINGIEELKIMEGTQPDQIYTLRGKGLPDLNGRHKGDQHVIIKVQVPTKLSLEQKELLKQFAATQGEKIHDSQEHTGLMGRLFGKH